MSLKMRHFLGLAANAGLVLAAIVLAGSHQTAVLHVTSFAIVFSASLGMAFALEGVKVFDALRFALLRTPLKADVDETLRTLEILAQTTFFGGIVGTAIGLVHASANFDRPDFFGPGFAVSVVCLAYSLCFNFGVTIPAKLTLLTEKTRNVLQPARQIQKGAILAGVLSLCGVIVGSLMEGAELAWFISYPGFTLALVAPIVTYKLYVTGIPECARQRIYVLLANLFISGGFLVAIFQLINLMENLDKPDQIAFRAGRCFVPLLYGIVGGYFCQNKALGARRVQFPVTTSPQQRPEQVETSYMPFAAFASSALGVVTMVVLLALNVKL